MNLMPGGTHSSAPSIGRDGPSNSTRNSTPNEKSTALPSPTGRNTTARGPRLSVTWALPSSRQKKCDGHKHSVVHRDGSACVRFLDWTDVPCRSFAPGAAYLATERVGGMAMSEQNIVDFIFCQNEPSGSDAIVDPRSFTVGAIAGWGTRPSTLPDSARLCHPRS